ncbi:MAG: hypothetical protein WCJ30_00885 [Deltaproteobacteria bacterium]
MSTGKAFKATKVSANWTPAIECPADQPIASCVLAPEQKLYTIKIQATMK